MFISDTLVTVTSLSRAVSQSVSTYFVQNESNLHLLLIFNFAQNDFCFALKNNFFHYKIYKILCLLCALRISWFFFLISYKSYRKIINIRRIP